MKIIKDENAVVIKSWCETPEDGAIQQAKNLARLPFVFKQVCLMPDTHQGYGMPIGGVVATKGVVIPNAVGVDIGCFVGSTKIPLLDGSERSLKELYDNQVKNFYVYSVNLTGDYRVGRADEVKLTRKDSQLVKITLDNNQEVICTPDQLWITNDMSEVEAQQLLPQQSLKALYRWYDKDGYETLGSYPSFSNIRTSWVVARSGHLGEFPIFKNKTVIHHKDENILNNYPSNLQFMDNNKHLSMHAIKSDKFRAPGFQEKKRKTIKDRGYSYAPEHYEIKRITAVKNITNYMKNNPEHFADVVIKNAERGSEFFSKNNSSPEIVLSQKLGRIKKIVTNCLLESEVVTPELYEKYRIKYYNYPYYKNALEVIKLVGFTKIEDIINWQPKNHKIIKVEKLDYVEDVYCITVDKYHNFALSAGVFVRNCGMNVARTSLTSISINDLKIILSNIRKVIPLGFNKHQEPQDLSFIPNNDLQLPVVTREFINAQKSIGTLGGGNHFIEIQKGDDGHIWIMIHSGSRNLGKQVADFYNKKAKLLNEKYFSSVPKEWELAFLPLDSQEGNQYLLEMQYCVDFAYANRMLIMSRIKQCFLEIFNEIGFNFQINIAHNYAKMENHFNQNVMVHRKGATSARLGELGLIPGSQGTASYIVIGKGNPESFMSCSHGAGRIMGRKDAERRLNLVDEQKRLDDKGILHSIRGVCDLDEAAGAYKSIDVVMSEQMDLVDIDVKLEPLAVIKG